MTSKVKARFDSGVVSRTSKQSLGWANCMTLVVAVLDLHSGGKLVARLDITLRCLITQYEIAGEEKKLSLIHTPLYIFRSRGGKIMLFQCYAEECTRYVG